MCKIEMSTNLLAGWMKIKGTEIRNWLAWPHIRMSTRNLRVQNCDFYFSKKQIIAHNIHCGECNIVKVAENESPKLPFSFRYQPTNGIQSRIHTFNALISLSIAIGRHTSFNIMMSSAMSLTSELCIEIGSDSNHPTDKKKRLYTQKTRKSSTD